VHTLPRIFGAHGRLHGLHGQGQPGHEGGQGHAPEAEDQVQAQPGLEQAPQEAAPAQGQEQQEARGDGRKEQRQGDEEVQGRGEPVPPPRQEIAQEHPGQGKGRDAHQGHPEA